jgi:Lsr2
VGLDHALGHQAICALLIKRGEARSEECRYRITPGGGGITSRQVAFAVLEFPTGIVFREGLFRRSYRVAERIVHQLIDDIDGSEIPEGGGERIEFSLRGASYQIDLSAANIAKLDKALKPYISAATKVRKSRGSRVKAAANGNGSASKEQLSAIRDWARKNGHEIADRGRIKTEVVEAFEAAH